MAVAVRLFGEMMDDQVKVLSKVRHALESVGARHALVGGHAVSAHTRPRLTIDIDLVVDSRRRASIESALDREGFAVRSERDVLRVLRSPGVDPPLADLLLADSHPVWAEALRSAVDADYQGQRLPVATVPALLAMKFLAATSLDRPQEDRLQDVSDMGRLAKAHPAPAVATEAARITELGYPGGGAAIGRLIADLLAGRPITI